MTNLLLPDAQRGNQIMDKPLNYSKFLGAFMAYKPLAYRERHWMVVFWVGGSGELEQTER